MYVQVNEEGRILATSEDGATIPNSFEFDFPDGFDFGRQFDYIIKDGVLSFSESAATIREKVDALKRQLAETDYITAKIAEGAATREEYADVITQRQAWRDEINKLEDF